MSASQRTKGHNFERDIASAVRPVYPDARRGQQSRAGSDAPDVDGTPWWVECAVGARPNILAKITQARAATDGRPVVVVTRRDRDEAYATMPLSQWLELVHAYDADKITNRGASRVMRAQGAA